MQEQERRAEQVSDTADTRVDWPRFKLVHFSAPTGIPHRWDAELLAKGAPDGLVCHVEDKLTLLEDPTFGPLVCFGTGAPDERLCLNPRTRQVICILYGAFGNWRDSASQPEMVGPVEVVGSSLDQFITLVRAATERFPFDNDLSAEEHTGKSAEDEMAREEQRFSEWAQAVLELEEILSRIDQAAVSNPGGFWQTFVVDVGMGNYATKNFLVEPDK